MTLAGDTVFHVHIPTGNREIFIAYGSKLSEGEDMEALMKFRIFHAALWHASSDSSGGSCFRRALIFQRSALLPWSVPQPAPVVATVLPLSIPPADFSFDFRTTPHTTLANESSLAVEVLPFPAITH
jgi:hypothetical protein